MSRMGDKSYAEQESAFLHGTDGPDALDVYSSTALRAWRQFMEVRGVDFDSDIALMTLIAGTLITGIQFAGRHPEYAMALVQGAATNAVESMDQLIELYPIVRRHA